MNLRWPRVVVYYSRCSASIHDSQESPLRRNRSRCQRLTPAAAAMDATVTHPRARNSSSTCPLVASESRRAQLKSPLYIASVATHRQYKMRNKLLTWTVPCPLPLPGPCRRSPGAWQGTRSKPRPCVHRLPARLRTHESPAISAPKDGTTAADARRARRAAKAVLSDEKGPPASRHG